MIVLLVFVLQIFVKLQDEWFVWNFVFFQEDEVVVLVVVDDMLVLVEQLGFWCIVDVYYGVFLSVVEVVCEGNFVKVRWVLLMVKCFDVG